MRAVSFVERLDFEFQGNVLKDAIALGDVDNDENHELVLGNVNGDIVIFKGSDTKAWRTADANGMVASLVIGDIFNENKNALLSLSGDGWCSIFEVEKEEDDLRSNINDKKILCSHLQRLMANTKMALICDIDGDGYNELVIAMSDRVVRSYRWSRLNPPTAAKSQGRLVAQNKWEFGQQIGSVSLNFNEDCTASLLISQPGGTCVQLNGYKRFQSTGAGKDKEISQQLEYHALASQKMRNTNVSTVIVGNISRKGKNNDGPNLYAIATLDGTLMLIDKDKIIWSLQVNHQLFAVTALDITGNGIEEVISCSWEGVTYIVNHEQKVVRFQFEDAVNTFAAGYYSVFPGENLPCLVYVTFNNHIYLYYDIQIPDIRTESMYGALQEKTEEISKSLANLHVDSSSSKQLQELVSWVLYGKQEKEEKF